MIQAIEISIQQDLAKAFRDEKISENELSAYLIYFSALENEEDLLHTSIWTFHAETGLFPLTMTAIKHKWTESSNQNNIRVLQSIIQQA